MEGAHQHVITAGDEEEWTRERATVIDATPEK